MSKKAAATGGGPENTMPGPPPPPPKTAPKPRAEVKPAMPANQGVNKAPAPAPKQAQAKTAQAPTPAPKPQQKPQQKPRVNAAGRLQAFAEGRQKLAPRGPQPHQTVGRAAARPTDGVKVVNERAGQAMEKRQAQAQAAAGALEKAAGPQATTKAPAKPSQGRSPSR